MVDEVGKLSLKEASPLAKGLLAALAVLALLLMWFNGVASAIDESMMDFNILYAGASLFASGENPYFAVPMQEVLGSAVPNKLGVQVTLPSVFGILSPITLLGHGAASVLWLLLNLVCIILSIFLLLRLAGLSPGSWYGAMLVVVCLLCGPFRMGLRQGQVDNLVLLLIVVMVLLVWQGRRRLLPAILLGVAIALKPTSAGLFSIHLLCRKRVLAGMAALIVSGGAVVICALILTVNVPDWWLTWREVIASVENDFNKVSADNPRLDLMTHLAAGIFAITGSSFLAVTAGIAVCLPIFLRTLFSVEVGLQVDRRELLLRELSIVSLVGMLVVYHRFYSAVLLVFPLTWAVHRLSRGNGSLRVWLVLFSIPFFSIVNGQAAFTAVVARGWIPWLGGDSLLGRGLQFHFVWLQLFVLLALFSEQLAASRFSIRAAFVQRPDPD